MIASLILSAISLAACGEDAAPEGEFSDPVVKRSKIRISGEAQGTSYQILCNDDIGLEQSEVDSVLWAFDMALSTYVDNSLVSRVNQAAPGVHVFSDPGNLFWDCWQTSQEIYRLSSGYFDPTIRPLMKVWGFVDGEQADRDSLAVSQARSLVSFEPGVHFRLEQAGSDSLGVPQIRLYKVSPGAELDFNAIAQGQSVDHLAELLRAKGARNFYVELGGELIVQGHNAEDVPWRIGVDRPVVDHGLDERPITAIMNLDRGAVATSGNYRKYVVVEGQKFAHTMDPHTGRPKQDRLLSVTILAKDCATADAIATACMAMGNVKARRFLDSDKAKGMEWYLIIGNDNGGFTTLTSPGMEDRIELLEMR